jgi:hypothetical protein
MSLPPETDDTARLSRGDVRFVAAVGMLAALLQALANSPRWLVHINWDAASYLHQAASGNMRWSSPTWTAHALLQYLYLAACAPVRWLGGTPADGFRFLNVLCFGATAAVLAAAAQRLLKNRVLAALAVGLWATAFVTVFLTFTLEDNIVFMVPAALLFALFACRVERWRWRDSVYAGLLASASVLLSVQGLLYVVPTFFFLLALPRPAGLVRRIADGAAAGVAFVAGIALFVGFFLVLCRLPWRQSLVHLMTRPTSTFPASKTALVAQLLDVTASLRTVGIAASLHLFRNSRPLTSPSALVALGAAVMALQSAAVVASAVRARRSRSWLPFLFASVLFGMTVMMSLYRDVEYAYLKRTDFVPMLSAFWIVAVLRDLRLPAGWRRIVTGTLGLALIGQLATGLAWRGHEVASYQTLDTTILGRRLPGYHGLPPEGSFLRHFRDLRRANPRACSFVFAFDEIAQGRWNPDITGTILSELPKPKVVVSPAVMKSWPRPLEALDPAIAKGSLLGCEWSSPAAQKALGLAPAAQ